MPPTRALAHGDAVPRPLPDGLRATGCRPLTSRSRGSTSWRSSATRPIRRPGPARGRRVRRVRPNLVLAVAAGSRRRRSVPLLADRPLIDGRPTAYVCRDFACRLPVTDPAALRDQLTAAASASPSDGRLPGRGALGTVDDDDRPVAVDLGVVVRGRDVDAGRRNVRPVTVNVTLVVAFGMLVFWTRASAG